MYVLGTVWFCCLHFCYTTTLKVLLLSIHRILLWRKFLSARKLMNLLSISVLGERYESMWTPTLRYSDCRWSCSPFTSYVSPPTSNHLRSYDVPPQWQFITTDGPKVISCLSTPGALEKRLWGVFKAQSAWKISSIRRIQRIPIHYMKMPPSLLS